MAQRRCILLLAASAFIWCTCALALTASAQSAAPQASPEAIAAYKRALAVYLQAREAFATVDHAYWKDIAQKRSLRFSKRAHGEAVALNDYVLTQPPKYTG